MIKVFGHIAPDTDTTGCAIIWAWYINTHTGEKATPFVLGQLNKETSFVLKHWNIQQPELLESVSEKDSVVIVDTNNPQELFPNILDTNILNIIDHHRLSGGLSTKSPLNMTIRPLASTATVIHDLMGHHIAEEMPKEIAGIMLSCILSDTLAFRSPTTTPHDKDVALKLAKKLNINIDEYADQMFKAKSDVSDFTDIGLVHIDSKKTTLGSKNLRISTIETTNPEQILARKNGIIKAIKEILDEEKDTDDVLFFIVDIMKEESTVITYNDFTKKVIEQSFDVTITSDTHVLPGIVSRKKQIIPRLKVE